MTDRDRTFADPRLTTAPALLGVLAMTLLLDDRVLEGSAQTVARIVPIAAVLAATAWCGSGSRGADRGIRGSRD